MGERAEESGVEESFPPLIPGAGCPAKDNY